MRCIDSSVLSHDVLAPSISMRRRSESAASETVTTRSGETRGRASSSSMSLRNARSACERVRPSLSPGYRIRPILHEPGPVGTRFYQSRTGILVRKGMKIDLQADYDARYPRARVMSIMHVYIAYGPKVRATGNPCGALPRDGREVLLRSDGHLSNPPKGR